MTTVLKFHYLRSNVIGAAVSTLYRFDVSPDSYNDAWEMLLKKYDNKRALIHTYLQSFVCFSKGKFESAVELKKLRDTMSVALATLSKLGCQVSAWDSLVVFIMTEKLGSNTRAKWNEQLGDPNILCTKSWMHFCVVILPRFPKIRVELIPLSIIREIKVVPLFIIYRFKIMLIAPAHMA
jgi:hypothetical protein